MYYAKKLWGASGGGGGEVVLNFVPFVAPESFNDPSKYADFGCTVNLHEKLSIYKMTYPGADIAVEFSNEIESVEFTTSHAIPAGAIIEIFETGSGGETSVLRTTAGTHTFTDGSTKRYMIRRITTEPTFSLPAGSVWAYCFGINLVGSYSSPYLKYIFFHENILTGIGFFRETGITGTLTINGVVPHIGANIFAKCTNLTKVITGNQLTSILGNNALGAFMNCTSLQVADLGTGIILIGQDTFRDCTSLASIICRALNPPTLKTNAFYGIPAATKFYVPHERVNAYKTAAGWAAFASRIFSINDL